VGGGQPEVVPVGEPGVAALAARQHGVVSVPQLLALGIGHEAVKWRARQGRLHRVHRGVYAVGHARLTLRGRWWAAVLACGGPGSAVLSHRSAAALWDLLPAPGTPPEVTTLRRSASTPAVRVHRSATLRDGDVTEDDGLPVTTASRTLADLAAVLSPHQLGRVCQRAEHLRLLDAAPLSGRRSRALRAALAELAHHDPQVTRSELEERFLALLGAAGLPRPAVNATVAGLEVDVLWPAHRLVVELDGAATHLTPTAFEEDRRRDAALQAAGYRVVRFTWRRVAREPRAVAAALHALLAGPVDARADR